MSLCRLESLNGKSALYLRLFDRGVDFVCHKQWLGDVLDKKLHFRIMYSGPARLNSAPSERNWIDSKTDAPTLSSSHMTVNFQEVGMVAKNQ